jgi:hypothetical protein
MHIECNLNGSVRVSRSTGNVTDVCERERERGREGREKREQTSHTSVSRDNDGDDDDDDDEEREADKSDIARSTPLCVGKGPS